MKPRKFKKRKIIPYTMIAPFFILYFVFSLYPVLYSFRISLFDWTGVGEKVFIGLNNYVQIFTRDRLFLKSLVNAVLLFIFTVPIEVGLGLFTACILKDFIQKGRNAFQLANFLPYVTCSVAVGIIFQEMFSWKTGVINFVIEAFGGKTIYWLGLDWATRIVVIIMVVWKNYGYVMVMFLSGLSTIPEDLYDSAKIDGASWWQSFWKITLPMLKPIMIFVVTTCLMNAWKLFDEAKLLFDGGEQPVGGPDNAVLTPILRNYDWSFHYFRYGYGSAYGVVFFVIIALTGLITVRVMTGNDDD